MATSRLLVLALPILLTLVGPTPAATQTIRGAVIDASTRAPLEHAEVILVAERPAEDTRAVTDASGIFELAAPRAGTYTIIVNHPGYTAYEADSVTIGTGEVVTVEIRLGQGAIPLQPLVVTVRRSSHMAGFDERRARGLGRYITREEIEARGAARVTDLLSGLPGLTFQRAGPSGRIILMSGGLRCQPAIWVDGIESRERPGLTMDELLTPNMIEGIEVYNSSATAPSRYVTGPCGVILFWTRRGTGEEGEPWGWKRVLAGAGAALLVVLFLIR